LIALLFAFISPKHEQKHDNLVLEQHVSEIALCGPRRCCAT